MATATEDQKSLGHLKKITFNITEPLNMKALEMSFDRAEKELPPIFDRIGNLTILVGANGTGKTFLLINVWCLASIANHAIFSTKSDYLKQATQFIYDHCFSNQNINGKIEALFTSGVKVSIGLKEGKVVRAKVTGIDSAFRPSPPTFMSSGMRTFESISLYLKTRKRIIATFPQPYTEKPEEMALLLSELVKDYKLYDVSHIESTINRCPISVNKKLNDTLKGFPGFNDGLDYKTFDVDLEKCDFYVTQGRSKKKIYLSTFGKGHQAIFNMFVTLSKKSIK